MSLNKVYLVCQVFPFEDYRHEIHLAFSTEKLAQDYRDYLIKIENGKFPSYPVDDEFYVTTMSVNHTQVEGV